MGLFKKNNDRFADMHNHILPGIDDGSRDVAMTMAMLRIAQKSGITDMIVTPHYKNGRHNAGVGTIDRLINEITAEMEREGLNIRLCPGNEIFYYDGAAEDLAAGKMNSLNGTDRVLIEFQPGEQYVYIRNAVDSILGIGYVPVVAHIERYTCMIDNPQQAEELKMMGAEIQVNASSVAGSLGPKVKKFIIGLLQEEYIDYVGTDAHDDKKRIPDMRKCMAVLRKVCDEDYIRMITCDNALSIIEA